MMFAIIINEQRYKVDFVVLNEDKTPQSYILKEGEQIIEEDWRIANAMGKPRWTGIEWIDEEPPKQIDICIDQIKSNKIAESKELLATWLEENPLLSTIHNSNGEYYNVTQDKQTQLTQMITLYNLSIQNNIEFNPTWNSTGSECEVWNIEELTQLTFEITQYVLPKVKKQQQYETQIKLLNTLEEIESLEIDYTTV